MPCWGQRSRCGHWLLGGRLVAPGAVPVPGPGSGPRPWGPCARRGAVAGGVCGTGPQRADEKRNRCSPAAHPSAPLPGPSTGGLSRQRSLWSFGVLCAAFLSLLAPPGLLEERACRRGARFGSQGQSRVVTDSAPCCWKQQTPHVHTHTRVHTWPLHAPWFTRASMAGCLVLLQQDGLRGAGVPGAGDGQPGGGVARHQAGQGTVTKPRWWCHRRGARGDGEMLDAR